ncbi:MAG TPA: hypothetical protein VEQ60_27710, partial [Longimicrobium sp.]|nr:hypothetical protein [Longimicrobium sp.]
MSRCTAVISSPAVDWLAPNSCCTRPTAYPVRGATITRPNSRSAALNPRAEASSVTAASAPTEVP